MQALAVFPDGKEVRLIDHPEPAITSPTQAKLRLLEVGICGTDREIVSFQYGTPPPGSEYLVIGHESLAEVVEVGSSVRSIKPGDLAVVMVRRPCPHPQCRPCRSGRADFCVTGDFTERGIKETHGFLTEFAVEEEAYLNPVPSGLRPIAVLTEPLTIAEKAISQVWQVQQRLPWTAADVAGPSGRALKAVVLGAGPVGLLGAMALSLAGFETTVYSRSSGPQDKQKLVEAFGARYVDTETHPVEVFAREAGNIDLIYEATGAATISFELLEVLGSNGVFVFTGVPGRKGPIELDADLIMRNLVLRNQIVLGTVNAPKAAYEAAIRDLARFEERWPGAAARLITGRFPLARAKDQVIGDAPGIKSVISLV